ncbi:related to GYP8 - GTPase-activating protein [Ustilago sp. UG-2017b]|nr:related to GYP8 - GTPase-activating protein [Ustilago sp. UG-2017b]
MLQRTGSAESATASSAEQRRKEASGSTDSAESLRARNGRQQRAKRRRRLLQQQCLQPVRPLTKSTSLESLVAAWLFLLDITQDQVSHKAELLSEKPTRAGPAESSDVPKILKESLPSPIPLDKDRWQVASDILEVDGVKDDASRNSISTGDVGWKVVKSKKTKRRKGAVTESTTSPPDSSSLGDLVTSGATSSTSRSTPSMSPHPDANAAPIKQGALALQEDPHHTKVAAVTDQERYPELSPRDIEQVAKDVERSFIGPAFKGLFTSQAAVDNNEQTASMSSQKLFRRKQLSHLVLMTLNRHPALRYFQGYHDILSVVLLTLAPQPPSPLPTETEQDPSMLFADATQQALLLLVTERISLHVIRDSLTRDLLPIMGQLKLLGNLIRLCDPALAELVDRASPLPFFALPWLLTLLTHDAGEVVVMQKVLAFVLAFGPSAAIYLCAAVLLQRKEEVMTMDPDELEDPAMLHTILGRLPHIVADSGEDEQAEAKGGPEVKDKQERALSRESSKEAIYVDPDVELPSLASDRALAASTAAGGASDPGTRRQKKGLPISTLLKMAVDLMDRYPLQSSDMEADKIMGPSSVLFTWSRVFDLPVDDMDAPDPRDIVNSDKGQNPDEASPSHRIDWSAQNDLAKKALTGPTDAIVRDPHPPPPTPPTSDTDEKHSHSHPHHHHLGKKRGGKTEWEQQAKMLAVVGISGLLVAALIGASQNPSNAASSAANLVRETTSEETKRVLTLIVSLLSNWGRVVESG